VYINEDKTDIDLLKAMLHRNTETVKTSAKADHACLCHPHPIHGFPIVAFPTAIHAAT